MTASIWAPGSNTITVNVNAENASLIQKYTAKAAQTVFLLTAFTYIPSTGSIRVYRNGVKLPGSEVSETDSTHFTLLLSQPLVAGECIECAAVLGSQDAVTAAAISAAASAAEAVAAAASAAEAISAAASAAEAVAAAASAAAAISAAASAAEAVAAAASAAEAVAAAASVTNTVKKTSDTGSAIMPAGPTSARDLAPGLGWTRFNTTLDRNETWNGTAWVASGGATGGGATGGGATGGGSDAVFYENDQIVSANYTLTSGKNAMSAGPITVADGVVVTIPSGSTWSIV